MSYRGRRRGVSHEAMSHLGWVFEKGGHKKLGLIASGFFFFLQLITPFKWTV